MALLRKPRVPSVAYANIPFAPKVSVRTAPNDRLQAVISA